MQAAKVVQQGPIKFGRNDLELHAIVSRLCECPYVVDNRDRLAGAFEALILATSLKNDSNYKFFKEVLAQWIAQKSSEATFENLVQVLRHEKFNSVADAISELQPKTPPKDPEENSNAPAQELEKPPSPELPYPMCPTIPLGFNSTLLHQLSPGSPCDVSTFSETFEKFALPNNNVATSLIKRTPGQGSSAVLTEASGSKSQNQERAPVHENVSCNGCQTAHIKGVRYKCSDCPNYDLCENCEKIPGIHSSNHILYKIKVPVPITRNSNTKSSTNSTHGNFELSIDNLFISPRNSFPRLPGDDSKDCGSFATNHEALGVPDEIKVTRKRVLRIHDITIGTPMDLESEDKPTLQELIRALASHSSRNLAGVANSTQEERDIVDDMGSSKHLIEASYIGKEILNILAYFAPNEEVHMPLFINLANGDLALLRSAISTVLSHLKQEVLIIHTGLQEEVQKFIREKGREEEILGRALKLLHQSDPVNLVSLNTAHPKSLWRFASKYGKLIEEYDFTGAIFGDRKETVLHLLTQEGDVDTINAILTHLSNTSSEEIKAILDAKDNCDWTCLHRAAENGDLEIVQTLLRHGANVNALRDDGWTPLINAVYTGQSRIVETLIEAGVDVNAKDIRGYTALHWAAGRHFENCVQPLLNAFADPRIRNNVGITPLDIAVQHGQYDIADTLQTFSIMNL